MIKFHLWYGQVVNNCFDPAWDVKIYNSSDDYQGIRNIIWTQTQSITDKLEFDMNPKCEFYNVIDVGVTHLITLSYKIGTVNHAFRFFPITIEQSGLGGELHVTCASSGIFASWLPMVYGADNTNNYYCDAIFGGLCATRICAILPSMMSYIYDYEYNNIFRRGAYVTDDDVYIPSGAKDNLTYLEDKYNYVGRPCKEYVDANLQRSNMYYRMYGTYNTNNIVTEYGKTTRFYDKYIYGYKSVFAENRLKDTAITDISMIKSFKHTRDLTKMYTCTTAYHTPKQDSSEKYYIPGGSVICQFADPAIYGKRIYPVSVGDDDDVSTVAQNTDMSDISMDDYEIVINPAGMEEDDLIFPCDCLRIDISQKSIELHGTFIVTEMKRYIDSPLNTTFKLEAVTLDEADGYMLNSTFVLGQSELA